MDVINENKRILWIDIVKILACILVVIGHFQMSMVKEGFYIEKETYYHLFIQTIYTFHVPLFFVCSGYLYQIKNINNSLNKHLKSIKIKAFNLIVPYVVFSLVTLILKIIFSSKVNNQATPIVQTLFLEPTAPYWFLYTLFFLFCIIPRINTKKNIITIFSISVIIKIIYILIPPLSNILPYIIKTLILNSSWFVFGMLLAEYPFKINIYNKILAYIFLIIANILAVIFYQQDVTNLGLKMFIGWLFVLAIIILIRIKDWNKCKNIIIKLNEYFLPVFLMHTIFAAGIRIIMFKLGFNELYIHTIAGFLASFIMPIIVYKVLKKYWFLFFMIEPYKALKMRR